MSHDWERDAVCAQVDPEMWFPDATSPFSPAIKMCNGCPVQRECLQESFDARMEFGVWGGLTATRRLSLLPTYFRRSKDDRRKMMGRLVDELQADQCARDRQLAATRERESQRQRLRHA